MSVMSSRRHGSTGGSRLSQIFWEHENTVRLKHYPAYPIIIISLIIQRNLATKIWAKWESSLTAVWLKWDPPVYALEGLSELDPVHSFCLV